jgi:hypothetical protein
VIIGGLAVAFLGRARTTRDVDAIVFVKENHWSSFLKKGEALSFRSRLPAPLDFARANRVFLLHHQSSGTEVDLSLGTLPFEIEALQRAKRVKVGRLSVPIATAEDLIVLKAVANRPQDWIDIEGILRATEDLDEAYIRRHVGQFAGIVERPDFYAQIDQALREHKQRRKRKKI